ncbi:MAG: hypothetical protein OXT06_09195 [Rhodospirillaceae bacterium]|nr:hypothetical protein [Rhodospirillaceae bacterium]
MTTLTEIYKNTVSRIQDGDSDATHVGHKVVIMSRSRFDGLHGEIAKLSHLKNDLQTTLHANAEEQLKGK